MQYPNRRNLPALTAGALAAAIVLALVAAPYAAATPPAPLRPASSGGLVALDRALARLSTHKRLLIIAAHPDDEDTRVLTWVARALGGEAAYLSLSRGEGGQNLIGAELGVGLGLLRSRELLAARGIDGARQYFSRAYDFGFTRSLDETLCEWPKPILLADAMRVIRRFKPQVLVAVFPPVARSGHGQHWASGVVAEEAFALSGDPQAFPELRRQGLEPWKVEAFYRSAWWNPQAATLVLPLGTLEPWTGRSIFQLALASRSQHRCQDMGFEQPLGDAPGRLAWVAGAGEAKADELFAGIDTRPAAIAEPLPPGELREEIASRLERVGELAAAARLELNAVDPEGTTEALLEIVRLLGSAHEDLAGESDAGARAQVRDLVGEKLAIAHEALATAAQVLADAIAERETVVPGDELAVRAVFWNAGSLPVEELTVTAVSPDGWRAIRSEPAPRDESFFATQVSDERVITVEVPEGSAPTVPYFLRRPKQGSLYDWSAAAPDERAEPFGKPPLSLRFAFTLAGVPVVIEREVVRRFRDQARGEVRRPLRAVPRLEVTVEPALVVWPIGEKGEQRLQVELRSNVDRPVRARIEAAVPASWPVPEPREVTIEEPFGRMVVEVVIQAPEDFTAGRYPIALAALTDDGERFDRAFPLMEYEHIRPTPMPRPARVEVSADEIRLPALGRVGYIRGASDRVPEFLGQIDLPLELLAAGDLAERDLAAFDAIVVGSRAYETDPALARANARLLAYARDGGLVIVQYQQYQFVRGGFAPYPLEIRRPHDRVTDERAPVDLVAPQHPVFTTPNRIGVADWEGWVQERGLYFAGSWDDAYQPLLAMADPGDEEKRGALLVAPLGRGHYVYTGLAFFRQLPAGVTGAYRLFANLLALGTEEEDGD
ncbi:MAG: PIG-L family deacetylase [bacterium]|nr:PIG-L family deacetylase [bacterium]